MHNWSLVCFTLLSQSAAGLVWISVLQRWFTESGPAPIWPLLMALILAGGALYAALAHLSRPNLAHNALRNFAVSWLSREVVLVQSFGGLTALLVLMALFEISSGLWLLECLALLLGVAAVWAMTKVYLIRTVPTWNTPATPLEFAGSSLLLGGAFSAVLSSVTSIFDHQGGVGLTAAGFGLVLGLILKLAAVPHALAAQKHAEEQTWQFQPDTRFTPGRVLSMRMGLDLAGLTLFLTSMISSEADWLWALAALCCLAAGEVLGRWRFYEAYARVGL